MPSNWRRTQVADLLSEGRLIIGDGYRAKNSELARAGLPFARAGNINNGFQFGDADCFPLEDLVRVGNKISQPGDVVFTSKGTVGRFAFVHSDTPRFVYSPQLCFWRSCDPDLIHPRFLYYWMHSREFFEQFKGVAGQTDMAEYVSLTDQRRMHVTLPSAPDQRAIAHILGTLDDKIELNRRMSETLEAMARALFRSWFVDFDPVRAKVEGRDTGLPKEIDDLFPDRFVDSELGEIPEGWGVESLDDIAHFRNGLALQKYPAKGQRSLPVIKIAQLRAGHTIGADRASTEIESDFIVGDGDVLFSWSGSLDCRLWCGGCGALNQHLFKVTSPRLPAWFCYYWIHQHLPRFREIAAGKATTMGHIQRHHLTDAKVVVPAPSLLDASSRLVGPMWERLVAAQLENGKLAGIRNAALPALMAGSLTTVGKGS